jgi:hypothetical protein
MNDIFIAIAIAIAIAIDKTFTLVGGWLVNL